jgi:hypothetical protein
MTFNRRLPAMEDDLKIWKEEYLSNYWLDLKFLTWVFGTKPECTNVSNKDDLDKRRPQNMRSRIYEQTKQSNGIKPKVNKLNWILKVFLKTVAHISYGKFIGNPNEKEIYNI